MSEDGAMRFAYGALRAVFEAISPAFETEQTSFPARTPSVKQLEPIGWLVLIVGDGIEAA
jgi:hypothetical protein